LNGKTPNPLLTHHGRNPIIIDRATPAYRALMLELDRRRIQLRLKMWEVDDLAGLNDGHYAHLLHADRPSGRQGTWASLHLVISALFPMGFDLELRPKQGGALTAESHALKVKFAAADHCPKTRRDLMRELGRRGAAARKLKLTKRERTKLARKASKVAAIKRTKTAAAQAKLESSSPHLSAPPCVAGIPAPAASCRLDGTVSLAAE
jgi:hypothetical protein